MSEVDAASMEGKLPKRACTECRQQKAKCDSYLLSSQPCSRCRKLGKPCQISEPFKREHKRKRLSELEQQTGELQERLRASKQFENTPVSDQSWNATGASLNVLNSGRKGLPTQRSHNESVSASTLKSAPLPSSDYLQTPESLSHEGASVGTLSRSLEGHVVEATDIDALFQSYFQNYAFLMPILDPSVTPNACYGSSPFLFWSVLGVSCRIYSRNLTILPALSNKIQTMALLTLNAPVTLSIIQGLLLCLHWPLPKASTSSGHDLTFPLCAATLHMAMSMGLHLPIASQEFSKVKIRLTEEELKVRAETWGYCTLIYQRYCWHKGNPATPMLDVPNDTEQRKMLFQMISPELKSELKLQDVITRCCIAVSQNGLRTLTAEQESSLDTLLAMFQAQITSASLECSSTMSQFHAQVASLVIQAFVLWKSPQAQNPTAIYDLGTASCRVIETLQRLEDSGQVNLSASAMYMIYSVMVSGHILLRLLRTSYSQYINFERTKAALFQSISLHKTMSVQHDDLPSRNGTALTQLWGSDRVFKHNDGSEAAAMRVRSRLTGSIVLDGAVWWREEFKGFMGVYPPPLSESRPEVVSQSEADTNPAPVQDVSSLQPDYPNLMQDPMLTEFGWPLSDDIFSSIWTESHVPTF